LGDQIKKNEMGGAGGTYGREDVHIGIWWGDLWEEDHLEDPGIDWGIICKWIFKWFGETWSGLCWLKIGTSGGRL